MKRLNKAFTLTELLVALGVIAILCSVLLPVIFNMMPNQNTIMAKRAYYTVQSVIADLINDEACYPDKTSASVSTEKRIGFDDAEGSPNCSGWTTTGVADSASKSGEKLTKLFTDKLSADYTNSTTASSSTSQFRTKDSMSWAFSSKSFAHTGEGGSVLLTVDVNGDGAPNCARAGVSYSSLLGSGDDTSCSDRTNGFDRFQMTIYGNGKIVINSSDEWAVNAVKVDRNVAGNGVSNDTDK